MPESKVNKEDVKAAQELRAERLAILQIEKQIAELKKSLSKYSDDELQTNRAALSLSETITKLSEQREKSVEKIRASRQQLRNLDRDELTASSLRERYTNRQVEASQNLLTTTRERRKLDKEETQLLRSMADSFDSMEDKSEKLLQLTGLRKDQEQVINGFTAMSADLSKQAADAIKRGDANAQDFAAAVQLGVSAMDSQLDLTEAQNEAQKMALKGQYQEVNLKKQKRELSRLEEALGEDGLELTTEQREQLEMVRDRLKDNIDKAEELNKVYQETAKNSKLGGLFMSDAFEKARSTISKLPMGDELLKVFKFDEIENSINQKIGGAFTGFFEGFKGESGGMFDKFKSGLSGMKTGITGIGTEGAAGMEALGGSATGAMQAASTGATGFGMSLAAATAGVTLIIAGVMKLVQMFMDADKEVSQLGKDLGISKKEAIGVHDAAINTANSMKLVGIHAEQVTKGLQAVGENLGGIDLSGQFAAGNEHVTKMVENATVLGEKFGLSGEEIGSMNSIAAITGKSVDEMAANSATLGKGIFTAKESMKILAGIPKSIVSQMAKMPEAMIKTAQHAKMLGMNMKQIADIGRKSLDIEESLEAEMEARALLGKDINLDTMRAAALNGDQETVMKELLNAAGSMAEFNDMNVLQKEALAKATGMEVDQLAEMLAKQEELNTLGLDQEGLKKLQAKNEGEILAMRRAGNSDADKAYNKALENLAAQKESAALQEGMESMMKRLQQLATKLVTPLLDMVDAFMGGKDASGDLAKSLGPIFDILGKIVFVTMQPLVWTFKFLMGLLSPIFDIITEISGALSEAMGTAEGGVGIFDAIKTVMGVIGDVIGVVGKVLMRYIIGPFEWIVPAITGIIKLFKGDFQGAITDFGVAIFDAFTGPFKWIEEAIAGLIGLVPGLGDKIKAGLKDILPGWAKWTIKKLFGVDIDGAPAGKEPEQAAGEAQAAGTTNMSTGEMPQAAEGGAISAGGLVLVGEKGPELVQLPTGATVASTGAGDQVSAILSALGLGGASSGEQGGEDKQSVPDLLQGILDFMNTVAAPAYLVLASAGEVFKALGSFLGVGKKEGKDGEKEKSPMEELVEASKQTAQALTEFVYGKEVEGKDGKKEKEKSIFEQLLDYQADILDTLTDLVLLTEQATGITLKSYDEKTGEYSAKYSMAEGDEMVGPAGVSTKEEPWDDLFKVFKGADGTYPTGVGSSFLQETNGGGMTKVEQKLDTLIGLFGQVANQPTVIKFGEKVVDEINTQINFKKAYQIGLDNTYGRTV